MPPGGAVIEEDEDEDKQLPTRQPPPTPQEDLLQQAEEEDSHYQIVVSEQNAWQLRSSNSQLLLFPDLKLILDLCRFLLLRLLFETHHLIMWSQLMTRWLFVVTSKANFFISFILRSALECPSPCWWLGIFKRIWLCPMISYKMHVPHMLGSTLYCGETFGCKYSKLDFDKYTKTWRKYKYIFSFKS